MSYHTWTTNGFGFCVDDIKTTPERILKLAALNEKTYKDLIEYLNAFASECKDEDLTIDDFDDFEGDYGDRGLSCIIREVINNELPIVFADDFDCVPYILYCPRYPWSLEDKEKRLTKEDVEEVFKKYINILTDTPVVIDYYSVENGG